MTQITVRVIGVICRQTFPQSENLRDSSPMLDRTDRSLVTEQDIRAVPAGETLCIGERSLVTPLAADPARERHIRLQRVAVAPGNPTRKREATCLAMRNT